MGINAQHLYDLVIMPALNELAEARPVMGCRTAKRLVLATIAHESQCGYFLRQVPEGGTYGVGRGIPQVEPLTHKWIYDELMQDKWKDLREIVFQGNRPVYDDNRLVYDMRYAVQICRLRYFKAPAALPEDNLEAFANYWGKYYQTTDKDLKTLSARERLFMHHARQFAPEFFG